MNENEVILEDLSKYLKGRGMESGVDLKEGRWYIAVKKELKIFPYYYISDGLICPASYPPSSIVSLADPEYREKFYKHLRGDQNSIGLYIETEYDPQQWM